MSPFNKAFENLVKEVKGDALLVLDSALTYLIGLLSNNKETEIVWDYGGQETAAFAEFADFYLRYIDEQLQKKYWCDAWGDLFMESSGNFKSFRGQFFTPDSVSNLCARITLNETHSLPTGRPVFNDCACGSARMLLAAQESAYEHNLMQPYLVGEDIDGMCCKMAAINLAVHGCFGEIIRHDSLKEPDELICGYIINESLYAGYGYPSIRLSHDKKDFWKLHNTRPAIVAGTQMTLF